MPLAQAPAHRARDARHLRADRERLGSTGSSSSSRTSGFKTFYPFRYRVLERALQRARGNQKEFLGKIEAQLEDALKGRPSIPAQVVAREKHLYSIYRKMQRKQSLLVGHRRRLRRARHRRQRRHLLSRARHRAQLFKPMPGRFKDYISIPRVNGYQSLHTTLFGPNGVPLEVQIRTEDMDKVAERGIAAHWQYKAARRQGLAQHRGARARVARASHGDGASGNSEEFLETVKVDLFPDKVYVFTPKGAIMRLPRGATAVDFAYAVHTDIGNRCVAAKIDRRLVPLQTELHNGETVEIVTANAALAESELGQLRRDRQGAQRDPRLPQELEARRGARARHAAAECRAGQFELTVDA